MNIEKITSKEIIHRVNEIIAQKPVFLWGANGEIITPEVIERLKNRFVSTRHTEAYYDEKLRTARGQFAMDDTGFLNLIAGTDESEHRTLASFINNAVVMVDAKDLNKTHAWILLGYRDVTTGKRRMGVYIGNNRVVYLTESNGIVVSDTLNNWESAFIPDFMTMKGIPEKFVSENLLQYQSWLNALAKTYKLGKVSVSGYFDSQTLTLSRAIIRQIYAEFREIKLPKGTVITRNEVIADTWKEVEPSQIQKHMSSYIAMIYMMTIRLYALGLLSGTSISNEWKKYFFINDYREIIFSRIYALVKQGLNNFAMLNRYVDSMEITDLATINEVFSDSYMWENRNN